MPNKNRYLVFVFFALLPVIAGIVGMYALLSEPYLGFHFAGHDDKWYISSIDTDSPAASYPELSGKEITYIGGWKIEKQDLTRIIAELDNRGDYYHVIAAQRYFTDNLKVGKPIDITIIQNNTPVKYTLTPSKVPLNKILFNMVIVELLIAGIVVIMGYVIVNKKQDEPTAVLFFVISVCLSLYTAIHGCVSNRQFFIDLDTLIFLHHILGYISLMAIPAVLHFSLIFPRETGLARNKGFIAGIYIIAAITTFILIARVSDWAMILGRMQHLIYYIAIVAVFTHTYFTLSSSVEKAKVKWVLLGLGSMLLIMAFVEALNVMTGRYMLPLVAFSFLLLPLSMAFGITRYKLMDIDTIFDNTIIYTFTLGILVILDIITITFLTNLNIINFKISEPFAVIIAVWAVIFAYLPVRNYFQTLIKKILRREVYNIDRVTVSLSEELMYAATLDTVIEKATKAINTTLHPKSITPILLNEERRLITGNGETRDLDYQELIKYNVPTPLFNIRESYNDGGILVPVIGHKGHLGCFLLSDKHSQRLYDNEDIKLLSVIARQVAMAIESVRYREELRKKEQEALLKEQEVLKEKERIGREVHDGMGSTFIQAMMLSDTISRDIANPDNKQYLDNLKRILFDGLGDIRDLLWAVEQEQNTLGDLVYHIRSKVQLINNQNNLQCRFESNIENEDIPVSPIIKLYIVRIIQEAITNTIKYANASAVSVEIRGAKGGLYVNISDNGVGFDTGNISGKGHGLKNICKRCDELGAMLEIHSKPPEGTEIKVELKLVG